MRLRTLPSGQIVADDAHTVTRVTKTLPDGQRVLDEDAHTFPGQEILKCAVMLRRPDLPEGSPVTVDYVLNTHGLTENEIDHVIRSIGHISRQFPVRRPDAPDELVYRFTDRQKLGFLADDIITHTLEDADIKRLPGSEEVNQFWGSRMCQIAYSPNTHITAKHVATATSEPRINR